MGAAHSVPLLAGGMGDEPAGAGGHRAVPTHGPVMPVWSRGGCDLPWPCPTRRRELRAEFADAPVSLALYLGAYLVQATEDMPWAPSGALHRRFVGWTREAGPHERYD